jgi:hypothetical protein
MHSLACPTCSDPVSADLALEHGTVSWPELGAFWYTCPKCQRGAHIQARDNELSLIRILGAPGPDWEVVATIPAPGLTVRADPGYLHIWSNRNHFEFPAYQA